MKQERFSVRERNSTQAELGGIIVSVVQTLGDRATIVVGHPGLPNIERMLHVGGALLFETSDGLFEVRVMSISGSEVAMLLTYVSPQPGIAGGFVDQDQSNSPFTPSELVEIAKSLQHIRLIMSERSDVAPEKLDFISRKLDEMQAASERFGRKDWKNLFIGTFTNTIFAAALDSTVAKALFDAAGTALSWLWGEGLKLLGN